MLQVVIMMALIPLGLSIGKILADIPLDAGTVVMLLVLGAFGGFIWHGSRRREPEPGADIPSGEDESAEGAAGTGSPEG